MQTLAKYASLKRQPLYEDIMMNRFKKQLTDHLWSSFQRDVPSYDKIFGKIEPTLDHFAIIDLAPSDKSGIRFLSKLFQELGYECGGRGYLPDKLNDFVWLRDPDSMKQSPQDALPQVVLADFRIENLSQQNYDIVNKYVQNYATFDWELFNNRVDAFKKGDESVYDDLMSQTMSALTTSLWSAPSQEEYESLKAENELLSWVLLFGRKVNHFGIGIYTMPEFKDLNEFNAFLKHDLQLPMNKNNGEIKGSKEIGIEQSSILGEEVFIEQNEARFGVQNPFLEFVWRYPTSQNPERLEDYYPDFVGANANNIIESLYTIPE